MTTRETDGPRQAGPEATQEVEVGAGTRPKPPGPSSGAASPGRDAGGHLRSDDDAHGAPRGGTEDGEDHDPGTARDPYGLPVLGGSDLVHEVLEEGLCRLIPDELKARRIDFFNEQSPKNVARAAAVCHECQLQRECLELAGTHEYGIWGGLTRSKRIKLRRAGGPMGRCPNCGSYNTFPRRDVPTCGECGTIV